MRGLAAAVSLLSATDAGAQPRTLVGAPAASTAAAQAKAHFDKGNAHADNHEWQEALGEFEAALALKRTGALVAAKALCLTQLERFDESLDVYDALRREFPTLSPALEAKVAPEIKQLQGKVGTVVVRGDAPAGALLVVDEKIRGTLPLTQPLRLAKGPHTVRAETKGFEPIVARVEVTPRQESEVRLQARSRLGRLQVREQHGWALDVEVDGALVGRTPWEGLVASGDHSVRVRGFVRVDALVECTGPDAAAAGTPPGPLGRAELGSPRATASVKLYEVTTLTPAASELDASLRVEATPEQAAVAVDGEVVGHGTWEGRLPLGAHTVEITAGGFLPEKESVLLERRKQPELHFTLMRAPRLGTWGPRRNVAVGVAYALGAAGVTVSAVAGADALVTISGVRSHCVGMLCPVSQSPGAARATTLATVSTVGMVVGGAGLLAGTALAVWYRPDEARAGKPAWSAALGPGRFELGGSF